MTAKRSMRPREASLADAVYRDLADLFMSGQVAPGDKLSLRGLAEQLGTSAMPVRAALAQIAAAGAVEILPQRAARVPRMTLTCFRDLLNIRLLLEGLAIVQATPRIGPAALKQARAFADGFAAEIAKARPNRALLVKRNKDLHFAIYAAAGSPVLLSLIERLWLLVGPVVNYDLRQSTERLRKRPALDYHARMISALAKRDALAAREALVGDLVTAAQIIIASDQLLDDRAATEGAPLDVQSVLRVSAGLQQALFMDVAVPAAV